MTTIFSGYTESAEKIAARKRRILKGFKPKRKKSGGRKPSGSLRGGGV